MTKTSDTYQKFSLIYDHMLQHVDYFMWADYIYNLSIMHNTHVQKMLDLACGTGSFIKEMSKYDIEFHGMELSDSMLKQAELKLKDLPAILVQGDMISFNLNLQFDLVTCLFDSVNYLDTQAKLVRLFNHVENHLSNEGIFIFDAVSEKQCLTHYFDYTENDRFKDIEYERRSRYLMNQRIQNTMFKFFIGDKVFNEEHNQYIYDHKFILDSIEKSNLNFEASYADFTFNPVDKDTERFHFVCKKLSI